MNIIDFILLNPVLFFIIIWIIFITIDNIFRDYFNNKRK